MQVEVREIVSRETFLITEIGDVIFFRILEYKPLEPVAQFLEMLF